MKAVVALFDHISAARVAIADLVNAGFKRGAISLIAHGAADEYKPYFNDEGKYRSDFDADDELTTG